MAVPDGAGRDREDSGVRVGPTTRGRRPVAARLRRRRRRPSAPAQRHGRLRPGHGRLVAASAVVRPAGGHVRRVPRARPVAQSGRRRRRRRRIGETHVRFSIVF